MTAVAWAKHAAEAIVSDDDLDEADAKKSDSRDWLKWALGIGLLGAGAYGAYKYSPQLKEALGIKLVDTAAPSNRMLGSATKGLVSSPAVAGAGIGALSATPFAGKLTESRLLNGLRENVQTLRGQGEAIGHASKTTGGRSQDAHTMAQYDTVHKHWADAGHPGTPGQWAQAGTDPKSGVAELASRHLPGATPEALAPDVGIGPNRLKAIQQTSDLIRNAKALGAEMGATVTYKDPATGADVTKRLIDTTPAEHAHLTPEQVKAWNLHNRAYLESGAGTPVVGPGGGPGVPALPREKFDIGLHGVALENARRAAPHFTKERLATNALGGALAGGITGWGVDKLVGAMQP